MIPQLIALVAFLLICPSLPRIRGWIGEQNVSHTLERLPSNSYHVFNNLMLSTSHGFTQIDHVVLSPFGIFVIETKNYKGWIYGSEYADLWTKNMYGKKFQFFNPIRQNYGHVRALVEKTNLPEDVFIPIVAFTPKARLFVKSKKPVLYYTQLRKEILKHTEAKISAEQIPELITLLTVQNVDSRETRRAHVQNIHEKVAVKNNQIRSRICPKCGGKLVERHGSYGKFLGCSNYPTCKYTAKL